MSSKQEAEVSKQIYTVERLLWAIQDVVTEEQHDMDFETLQSVLESITERETELRQDLHDLRQQTTKDGCLND
ncbi:hypothetical protein [Paenibacillus protaetiae]|uniref:Uncharacterized protein n=1 Tax=Paenibacillus protaetiae TaxID=2509456 RepID=A0A4P6EX94_9BACL|nr:hypothetical protein [Paenibacillus protaetiae]QAY66359.1 hypothetical protein ET464_08010 [Paenibacillus protaetiae]